MKREVAQFVKRCLTYQRIKAEHQKPAGMLKPLAIPEWKWEHIAMDFVTSLPKTVTRLDTIWVVVNRLTKSAHFLPIKTTYDMSLLAKEYVSEIVRLHGVPVSIISNRDPHFTSRFWQSLQVAMRIKLNFSTAFHPQTDGQSERTIQTLEDMMRACVLDFKGSWSQYIPLIEFTYKRASTHAQCIRPSSVFFPRVIFFLFLFKQKKQSK
jgi:hypothetical protein